MLYLHFCPSCRRIHVLSGHRKQCPACSRQLSELSVSYDSYIEYTIDEREALRRECSNRVSDPKG